VILNGGFGLIEMLRLSGWLAGPQGRRARFPWRWLDNPFWAFLPYLGEPCGAPALPYCKACSFALGLGVLAATIYRLLVLNEPEASLMNRFGLIALIVNIAAAWVLSKHREGDANVRAVWLFSRNDAIGNVAVIIAAGLVWFTESAWPDLIVAFGIAGLFLHSSFDTVRDARRELQEDSPAPVQ
jgi:hypothetical protein